MSKTKKATENLEIIRKTHIYAVQSTYNDYKQAIKNYYDATFYDDNGNLCVCGDLIVLGEKMEIAEKTYLRQLNSWKEWKEKHLEAGVLRAE